MATVRVFNDIFEEKSEEFVYDTSKPLLEQIEEHIDKECYKSTLVECYDPDTGKTFYAPLEADNDTESVIIIVNGESVDKDYSPEENDLITVFFTPLGGNIGTNAQNGIVFGAIAGLVLGALSMVVAPYLGIAITAKAATLLLGGSALIGGLIGFAIGNRYDEQSGKSINSNKKEAIQQPDVRGCANQSIVGNNIPFVIGKHLATPFIVGDPYTEYEGEKGQDAYIRELLCVGYSPLRLTDFKLGDFMLAYNRSHGEITKNTMLAGLLKGYSSGGVADNGDIVDYWSKNDIEIEILQQPNNANVVTINPYYQERTQVNLSRRPKVAASRLRGAGWSVEGSDQYTLFTQIYTYTPIGTSTQYSILMTPITPSGDVVTKTAMDRWMESLRLTGISPSRKYPNYFLAGFKGSASVSEAEAYAQALQADQDAFYTERNCIGYGTIYPEVAKEQQVDANILYIADKELDEAKPVSYKGVSFPNKFRTNTVIISEPCPRQFTINLDFPSGLYRTRNETSTSGSSTENTTVYDKITLWMCIQWRVCNPDNPPSKADGTDYDDWNTIPFEDGYFALFNETEQNFDKSLHQGNDFGSATLEDIYQGFRGKNLQHFYKFGGEDSISEMRYSATVTLTKQQCKDVISSSNPSKCIEIRVLRVSPNYINELTDSGHPKGKGAWSYSDHVKVSTVVTKTFDLEALRDDDELKPVRVVSEEDLSKLCLVAIKAKADNSGYIQNQMENITCIAQSFSPIWDTTDHQIVPDFTRTTTYYGYYVAGTNQKTNRSSTADMRTVTREQWEEARHEGYDWDKTKGTTLKSQMNSRAFGSSVYHNLEYSWYQTSASEKFNNNLASSGALLALGGPQAGPEGCGLQDINAPAFGEWAEQIEAVNDGTKAPAPMDYNGVHYNEGDLIPVRMEANAYLYSGTKIEDLLQKLALCGRAIWIIDETGRIKFIMDAPVDYTKGAINAQNCISSSNTFTYEDLPAGLFCTFNDENDGFENNSFHVWTDGNSAGRYHGSIEPFNIEFVTNNVQIASLARYVLACRVQQKESLVRKIGPSGMLYSIGDVILVQSDELLIGDVSGRIQQVIEEDGVIYGFVMDSMYEYTGELDGNNSVQGVTIIQPAYMGKSNAVTLPLSSPRTQTVITNYVRVIPVGTENPHNKGWYELIQGEYVLTEDTTVQAGKDYYEAKTTSFTLQPGLTNVVLFGKVIGNNYGVPRDTSEDYSVSSDIKYNFKTGDTAMMGLIDKIAAPYRITKIKPESGGKFTETLVPYDESLYNYGTKLPSFQSYITPPQPIDTQFNISEVPTTISSMNDSLQSVYNAIGVLSDDTPPSVPGSIQAIATRDFISLSWINTESEIKYTVIEISRDDGTTWTRVAEVDSNNWKYYFDRQVDEYPEATDLADYQFRFKNVSMSNVASEQWAIVSTVNTSYYGTWVPATPVITQANADKDGISIKFTVNNSNRYGTPKYTAMVVHGGNSYPVAIQGDLTARYTFDRDIDKYPEAADFATWSVTVNNSNETDPTGQTSVPYTVTANGYGTWIIPQVSVTKEVIDRNIILTAVYTNSNVEVYGNIQTLLKIKRIGNLEIGDSSQTYNDMFIAPSDSEWFTPEFTKNVGRTVTADAQAFRGDTEWNYKAFDSGVPKKAFYVSTSNKITHTLPLIGQNPRIYKLGNIPVLQPKEPSDPDVPYYEWLCVESLTMPASPIGEGEVVHYIGEANIEQGGVVVFASKGYYLATGAEVTPAGTENPQEEGWYVIDDGKYELTTDTTVVSGTTYYEVSWEQVFCKSLAVNTTYQYMIGMTNEAYPVDSQTGEKTGVFASTVTATALPTNISDIVHSHEHYKKLYVEKLSAINANIGLISQGGMGSFAEQLNYWALSDMTAEECGNPGGVKKGAFRVGGTNEYFKVTPLGNDNYKIELKAGNIELTSTAGGGNGMDFLKGTFVYSQDKLQRLALTPEGILVQTYTGSSPTNPNPNDYTTTAQVTINSNNDMIISNSDENPEFGHQVESTGAKIYHLDGNALDEDGTDPMGVTVSGSYVDNSADALLITNDRKCLEGTVVKTDMSNYTGQIAFVTMSEEVQIGDTAIKIDGTTESDIPAPLTGYNDAMKETSTISGYTGTVGSYLGLSESQVQNGIFF
jgi:hypothetical protein